MSAQVEAAQAALCTMILARLDAQHVKGKATRTKRAIDMLCGAAGALHLAKSDQYSPVS